MSVDAMGAAFERVAGAERDVTTTFSPALPDNAFAIVADGRGGSLYTRDGAFTLRDGTLVDASGRAVQGRTRTGAPLGDLRIDALDLALGRANDIEIGDDGTVSYRREAIDPRTGSAFDETVRVGNIALARFPFTTQLRNVDGSHLGAPDGTTPLVGSAGDGTFGPLGGRRSQADLDATLRRLQEAYLALDALRAAHSASGSAEKNAMDLVK